MYHAQSYVYYMEQTDIVTVLTPSAPLINRCTYVVDALVYEGFYLCSLFFIVYFSSMYCIHVQHMEVLQCRYIVDHLLKQIYLALWSNVKRTTNLFEAFQNTFLLLT